jgi:hypothetical protein
LWSHRRGHRSRRVFQCVSGHDVGGSDVATHEVHRESARLLGRCVLRRIERWNPVQAGGADPEELERRRHRVGGELTAAGAGPRAGDALELVQLGGAHRSGRVRADALEHVLDRDVATAVPPRCDRAVVEDEARDVEAAERHHRRRDGLVAAHEANEAVEEMPPRDQLDRVGDHLARDERCSHPLGAHRDAVRDGDRVELERRASGRPDAALDVLGERPLVEVARHRLDPARGNADQRAGEVVVGEADRLEHRPGGGAVGTVGKSGALALGRVRRAEVRVAGHSAWAPLGETERDMTRTVG